MLKQEVFELSLPWRSIHEGKTSFVVRASRHLQRQAIVNCDGDAIHCGCNHFLSVSLDLPILRPRKILKRRKFLTSRLWLLTHLFHLAVLFRTHYKLNTACTNFLFFFLNKKIALKFSSNELEIQDYNKENMKHPPIDTIHCELNNPSRKPDWWWNFYQEPNPIVYNCAPQGGNSTLYMWNPNRSGALTRRRCDLENQALLSYDPNPVCFVNDYQRTVNGEYPSLLCCV